MSDVTATSGPRPQLEPGRRVRVRLRGDARADCGGGAQRGRGDPCEGTARLGAAHVQERPGGGPPEGGACAQLHVGGLLLEIDTPEALIEARYHVEQAITITDNCIGETELTSAES
eukprot:622090-Prymnesium_polylepis.1